MHPDSGGLHTDLPDLVTVEVSIDLLAPAAVDALVRLLRLADEIGKELFQGES